ncbi:MAG: hypothetical protein WA208_17755 [Thermoanaerobaculia bacterium]
MAKSAAALLLTISSLVAVPLHASLRVYGYLRYSYRDYNSSGDYESGSTKPIRYATVEIRNSSNTNVGSTWTNNNGYFDVTVSSLSAGSVMKLVVWSDTQYATVMRNSTSQMVGVQWTYDSAASPQYVDLTVTSTVTWARESFHLMDAALRGHDYALARGMSIGAVDVYINDGCTSSCTYYTNDDSIRVGPSDVWADSIYHEYGHFINDKFSISRGAAGLSNHSLCGTYSDLQGVFGEAWAHYIACSVTGRTYRPLRISNIETMSDCPTKASNAEGNVAAVLWDFGDPANESFDTIASEYQKVWDVNNDFYWSNPTLTEYLSTYNDSRTNTITCQYTGIGCPTAPSTPSGLSASASSCSQINVSWGSVSGASGYRLYRAGTSTIIYEGTSTFFNDSNRSASTQYCYQIAAYNSGGESTKSSQQCATTPACIPSTPASLSASATSCSTVSVSWGSVNGATGYRVYRAGTSTVIYDGSSTAFTDSSRSASTQYCYQVTAYNGAGESTKSSQQCATTPACVPSTPAGLSATATSCSTASVRWGSVNGATGYRVYRAGTSTVIYDGSSTSFTDSSRSASTQYCYQVTAYNGAGESTKSSQQCATTPSCVTIPATPSNLSASATSCSLVVVSWSSVSGATGYRVYRSGTSTVIYDGTSTSFTDSGRSALTQYCYQVTAYNSAGESTKSAQQCATTPSCPATPPGTPTGLSASATSCSVVSVSWSSVTGASAYRVYRAGTSTVIYDGASTSFSDSGRSASSQYCYEVTAYNGSGESSKSAQQCATTPSCGTCSATALSCPYSGSDALTTNSCQQSPRGTGYYSARYTVTSTAGVILAIDMMSASFDTYLYVTDAGGNVVAYDDDGGDGSNSRLDYVPTSGGTLTIHATTYSSNVYGPFQLAVTGCQGAAASVSVTVETLSTFPRTSISMISGDRLVNGMAYFFGGETPGSDPYQGTNAIDVFDTTTETWSRSPVVLPYGMIQYNVAATYFGGRFYLGPTFATGNTNGWGSHNRVVEVPLTGQGVEAATFPYTAIWGVGACETNGKVYFFGGHTGSDTNGIYEYVPTTDQLTLVATMQYAGNTVRTVAGSDGWIYFWPVTYAYATYRNLIQRFHPVTHAVETRAATLPYADHGPDHLMHSPADRIVYFFKGGPNPVVYQYDYANDVVTNTGATVNADLSGAPAAVDPANPRVAYVLGNTPAGGYAPLHRITITPVGAPPRPSGLMATAQPNGSVTLAWNVVVGATQYDVARLSDNEAFHSIATVGTNVFTDSSTNAAHAYLYFVRARTAAGAGPYSAPDLATTVVFSDDPLGARQTPVRAAHLLQLRTAAGAIGALAHLPSRTWLDTSITERVTPIRKTHIEDLRSALSEALTTLGLRIPGFTDATLATGGSIKAAHVQELRNATK